MDRRLFLASTLAVAACGRREAAAQPTVSIPPLKSVASFPVGTCVMTDHLDDPRWVDLATTHVDQLTPEWEMKMEYILARPGSYRFDAPDRIADFARDNGMRLYGHALIWYSQGADAFRGLDDAAFEAEFDRYIAEVAGRYRGRAVAWDVVNEPVAEDGVGLRDCHWSQRFGQDGYIRRAFEKAREADPDAVLFLNDYNLENNPVKGATYLRLVERLLAAGTPITGLATQSHLDIDIPAGQTAAFLRELGQFGLPVHVSELDASLRNDRRLDFSTLEEREALQTARVAELAQGFMDLPESQRFAFSVWGLRDKDSWLRRGDWDDGKDRPLMFDWDGRPKPVAKALADILAG